MVDNYKIWMQRSQSSLKIARIGNIDGICYEDLCFQAQQSVEKALSKNSERAYHKQYKYCEIFLKLI